MVVSPSVSHQQPVSQSARHIASSNTVMMPHYQPTATTAAAPPAIDLRNIGTATAPAAPTAAEYPAVHHPHHPAGPQKKHVCHWTGCPNSFDHVTVLGKHILDHHINCHPSSDPLSTTCLWADCPRIGKAFSTKMKLIMHVRAHTGEKPYGCSVPGCTKRFSRMDILNKHLRSHSNSSNFVCVIHGCGQVFSDAQSFAKHRESHPSSKPHVCPVPGCGKRYTDGSGLYKHTEQCHQDDEISRKKAAAQLTASIGQKNTGAPQQQQQAQPMLQVSTPRRNHPRSQKGQDQDFETGEGLSDSDDGVERMGDSEESEEAEQNDLSDYDDEVSPTRKSPPKKSVSFSSAVDLENTTGQQQSQPLPYLPTILPPSSTGTNYATAANTAWSNGVPSHLQSTFRVNITQTKQPSQESTTLKRRSTDMDEPFYDGVNQESFAGPLRHSPSFTLPLADYSASQGGHPNKQARVRISKSEPNLKAIASNDLSDDEEMSNAAEPQSNLLQPPQQQPQDTQDGALDLLYFSQHPKTSPNNSVPSSPVPSPIPPPSSMTSTATSDSLKLPPLASLRLGSPVMSHVEPRYNSFTSLPPFGASSAAFSSQAMAAPTTPSREPVPAIPRAEVPATQSERGYLPPLTSFSSSSALPPLNPSGTPVKLSKSAPNLASEAGHSLFSFAMPAASIAQLCQQESK